MEAIAPDLEKNNEMDGWEEVIWMGGEYENLDNLANPLCSYNYRLLSPRRQSQNYCYSPVFLLTDFRSVVLLYIWI